MASVRFLLQILLCVVLFGVSSFCRKMSVDRLHPLQLQTVAGLVYALQLPVWLYLLHRGGVTGPYDRGGVSWGVACVLANMVGAVVLSGLLKSSSEPGVVLALVSVNPVVTGCLTVICLGEEVTPRKVLATGLMAAGFVLFNLR